MADNIIQYGSRTFGEFRDDMIAYIKQAYPDVYKDFTDSNVGSLLMDLNAGIADNLSYNTDRAFQETQINYAQQKSSIFNIAANLGFNVPPKRPSVTVVDFTATIPVKGNAPDSSYYPVLETGAQVVGAGKIFETQDNIDWNSSMSNLGDPNRKIVPNLDSNGVVVSYSVTKREVVLNGSTSIYKKVITAENVTPFFTVTLPESNVLSIDSIILLEGTSYSSNPDNSEFYNSENRFYEVDYLAQQRVFVEDTANSQTDIKAGKWIDVTKKFIKEYTPNGYCKIIFGSGDSDVNAFQDGLLKEGVSNKYFLENFLVNTALGEKLKANYTLFIKYRTGGGSASNIGANTLTQLGQYTLNVNGSRQDYNQTVSRSLTTTNPIPAIGGNDSLSVDQVRYLSKYNFSAQYRDVTLTDYMLQLYKMPGQYGSAFRSKAFKENNKVVISILDLGSDGKLSNTSNSLLKTNIAEYLSQFRMVNDFIEVKDGKIINLAFEIDVFVENITDNQIANGIITAVKNYFDVTTREMNEDIYLGQLQNKIIAVDGVVNLISIKVFNKVGGNYSNNQISQTISDTTTGEISLVNNAVYSTQDSMFEIKYPETDIKVLLRKKIE